MNLDTNNAQFGAQAICANGAALHYALIEDGLAAHGYAKETAATSGGGEVVFGGGGSLDSPTMSYLTAVVEFPGPERRQRREVVLMITTAELVITAAVVLAPRGGVVLWSITGGRKGGP